MTLKNKIKVLIILLLSFGFNFTLAYSSSDWTENFNNGLAKWDLYGYKREGAPSGAYYGENDLTTPIPSGFRIENNILKSSFNYFNYTGDGSGNVSAAWHDSLINYGTWSFDVFVDNWSINPQNFQILFLAKTNYDSFNFSGKSMKNIFIDLNDGISGFSIQFQGKTFNLYTVYFFGDFQRTTATFVRQYPVTENQFNSFHNIRITRDKMGQFKAFIDNNLVMAGTDNSTLNSEKFGFISYYGHNQIANITVTDQICSSVVGNVCLQQTSTSSELTLSSTTTTTAMSIMQWIFFPIIMVIAIVYRKFEKEN